MDDIRRHRPEDSGERAAVVVIAGNDDPGHAGALQPAPHPLIVQGGQIDGGLEPLRIFIGETLVDDIVGHVQQVARYDDHVRTQTLESLGECVQVSGNIPGLPLRLGGASRQSRAHVQIRQVQNAQARFTHAVLPPWDRAGSPRPGLPADAVFQAALVLTKAVFLSRRITRVS